MGKVTVGQLARDMKFQLLTPEIDVDEIELVDEETNRPALQLTGFFQHFRSKRVQLLGNVEMSYIRTLSRHEKIDVLDKLLQFPIPCIVFCRGYLPDEDMLALARHHQIPFLGASGATGEVSARILRYTKGHMAKTQPNHGVILDIIVEGVLNTGESGVGKSEAALGLIRRGHRLVADDAVELRKLSDDVLVGRAPEVTKHFIELRGIGIIDVKNLFGVESVKDEQEVHMVIHLEDWDRDKTYDRLGNKDEMVEFLDHSIPKYVIPVRPGRNLAVIIETAAMNHRQKKMGYDAVEELYRRVQENMIRNR